MKKNLILLFAIIISASMAYADGMVFDPTEYPAVNELSVSKTSTTSTNTAKTASSVSNAALESNIKILLKTQYRGNQQVLITLCMNLTAHRLT